MTGLDGGWPIVDGPHIAWNTDDCTETHKEAGMSAIWLLLMTLHHSIRTIITEYVEFVPHFVVITSDDRIIPVSFFAY